MTMQEELKKEGYGWKRVRIMCARAAGQAGGFGAQTCLRSHVRSAARPIPKAE